MTADAFIEPMLAVKLDWDKIATKASGYTMEPKLDGVRCIVHVDVYGVVKVYSRTQHDLTGKIDPELYHQLSYFKETLLDGELGYQFPPNLNVDEFWPRIDFNKTMRVLGSGDAVAQQKILENVGGLKLFAFDLLRRYGTSVFKNEDFHRRECLERVYDDYLRRLATLSSNLPVVHLVEREPGWDESKYTAYVAQGGEGVILKNMHQSYKPGKRPANHWFKVKKFDTMDVKITGSIRGQGKYWELIGALTFVTEDGIEGKCSGMTDAEREMFTYPEGELHPGYTGRWMEIRYFGNVGKDGTGIRHPQFVRMRPDKD